MLSKSSIFLNAIFFLILYADKMYKQGEMQKFATSGINLSCIESFKVRSAYASVSLRYELLLWVTSFWFRYSTNMKHYLSHIIVWNTLEIRIGNVDRNPSLCATIRNMFNAIIIIWRFLRSRSQWQFSENVWKLKYQIKCALYLHVYVYI